MALPDLGPRCYLNDNIICSKACSGYEDSLKFQSNPFPTLHLKPEVLSVMHEVDVMMAGIHGTEGSMEQAETEKFFCPEREGLAD